MLRTGRITTGQARALAEHGASVILPFRHEPLDFAAVFGRQAPTVLEIGFGMGEATAQIAATLPGTNFLCCEVHDPGVGALVKRIQDQQLANIRIVQHDAVEVLEHMVPPASLDGVHVFFPDPWHKKRHHKRRLIQPPLVSLLASRLKAGGYLHCATDWEPYAQQMLEVLGAEPGLANTAPRLRAQAGLPAADQVRAPRPQARPRSVGPGVHQEVMGSLSRLRERELKALRHPAPH